MNKNFIVIIICVGLLALAAVGYGIWNNANSPQVTDQNQDLTSSSNNVSVSQPSSPIVATDSVTAPYISTVVVKGTVKPNGDLTTYWFEYGETTALGTQTSAYSIGSGYTTLYTPAYITGLKSNTTYYFRLSAKNSVAVVNGTTYSFKTNNTPPPSGKSPTTNTLSASDIARVSVNLNGQINPNGSGTTYWFEYGTTSGLGLITSLRSSTDNGTSLLPISVSVSDLKPLTKYYFRLDAQNQFGTVNGQVFNFTTKGPAGATIPAVNTNSVNSITNSSAKLNASVNPNGSGTTYWFEYSKSSFPSGGLVFNTPQQSLSVGTLSVNLSTDIISLTSNTKYYVRIVAMNQYGTVRGDTVSFTTKK